MCEYGAVEGIDFHRCVFCENFTKGKKKIVGLCFTRGFSVSQECSSFITLVKTESLGEIESTSETLLLKI